MLEFNTQHTKKPLLENILQEWAKGPGETEENKCKNAESVIKRAITNDPTLSDLNITIFTKGSFKNRTNISTTSDVDICVQLNTVFYNIYPPSKLCTDFGYVPSSFKFQQFQELVYQALNNSIKGSVIVGDKSIKLSQNSYRVQSDVVPVLFHKKWSSQANYNGLYSTIDGTSFFSKKENRVIYNYPEQSYQNSITKNEQTKRRYKRTVRILKNLQTDLVKKQIINNPVSSFLIESLAWNTPNDNFLLTSYSESTNRVLAYLCATLKNPGQHNIPMLETNGIKPLFDSNQPWNINDATICIEKMLNYLLLY